MGTSKNGGFGLQLVAAIIMAAGSTWLIIAGYYVAAIFTCSILIILFVRLITTYKRRLKDLTLVLNAIENGDYSLRFSEEGKSQSHRTLNRTLNRIKEILSHSREEAIAGEQFLSHVIERIPVGILIAAPEGYVYSTNTMLLQLLGVPILTHLSQLSQVSPDLPQLFYNAPSNNSSHLHLDTEREGKEVSLRFSSFDIRNHTYHIYTLSNIGKELDSREAESWIRLIRVMTHEIMNSIAPITSICDTLIDNLQEAADQEMLATGLDTIRSTGNGLLSFVQDYRKLTAVPNPEKEYFELKPFLENILRLQGDILTSNEIAIDLQGVSETIQIIADKQLLSQVMLNLVKNAAEADYAPEIETKQLRIRAERAETNDVLIQVENNGLPIPPEVLDNIFVPFYTTKEDGSGIGLSLSRQIIRMHGGNLLSKGTADGYTAFIIELPL